MKLTVNLAPPPDRWHRLPVIVLWSLAGGLLVAAALFLVDALAGRAELPRLNQRLALLDGQRAAIAAPALPPPSELAELGRRVAFLNQIGERRGWDPSEFLAWLERHQPDDVRLLSLQFRGRAGEAVIVAESAHVASLTTFLLRMEREPRFAEVMLNRQGGRGEGGGGSQVEVRLRFKP